MGEENNAPPAGAADTNPQPQAGTLPPSEPQAGDEQISLDEARKLRSESRNLRERLKAAEAKSAELDKLKADQEAATLSETQRLQKQLADLQAKYDAESEAAYQHAITNEAYRAAMKHGVIDPDAAVRLIDWESVDVDDNGKLTNIDKVMQDLLKARPYLAANSQQRQAPTSGGATNPPRSQTQATTAQEVLARLRAGTLTADEYGKLPPDVRAEVGRLNLQRR